MEQDFGVQGRKGWATGNQPRQQPGHLGSGETAPRNLFSAAADPRNFEVLAGCGKFNKLSETAKELSRRSRESEVHGNDGRKVSRPLPFMVILTIAGGDDMPTEDVGFINPILVQQHLIFAAAAETAVQNVIAAFEGETHAFADDERARTEVFAEHTETPD